MVRRRSVYEQYGNVPLTALTEDRMDFMRRCLELRVQGYNYNQMAEELDCEYTTCRKAVKEALAQSVTEMADEVRAIEMNRLDELLMAHWPNREHPRHADVVMKLMDRRAKYLGLDVPQTDLMDAAQALRDFLGAAVKNTGADVGEDSDSPAE